MSARHHRPSQLAARLGMLCNRCGRPILRVMLRHFGSHGLACDSCQASADPVASPAATEAPGPFAIARGVAIDLARAAGRRQDTSEYARLLVYANATLRELQSAWTAGAAEARAARPGS